MKYVIKSQVKPYTRTRKGKMERVGGYSREKSRERLTHLPLNTLHNLLGDKDPDTKEFQSDVRAEIAKRRAPKKISNKGRFNELSDDYIRILNHQVGEPYDTRQKEYAQPKEGAIEKIGDKWMIARKVMVEVKRDKFLPEVQWTLPKPEDIPAVKARAQKAAETIVAGHQAKYKIIERMRAEEETARKKMAGAKTEGDIKRVLREWGTALYRKKKVGQPYSVKEHTEAEYKNYLNSLKEDEKELSLEQWKLRLALENPEIGEPFRNVVKIKKGRNLP